MILENIAVMANGEVVDPKHVVEILCPNCERDVDEAELAAKVCNDCGYDLSTRRNTFLSLQPRSLSAVRFGESKYAYVLS